MNQRNYFWVFQNRTFKEESQGGFLWAPQKNESGRPQHHWTRMKSIKQGDAIIHSVDRKIVAVSIAKADCYAAQKPSGNFDEWQDQGWRVDSKYFIFDETISTKDYAKEIISKQPEKYAPINKAGDGNTGYLFSATEDLFVFLLWEIAACQSRDEKRSGILQLLNNYSTYSNEPIAIEKSIVEEEYIKDFEEALNEKVINSIQDAPKEKGHKKYANGRRVYKRNPQVAANTIKHADFKCEVDGDHKYFVSHRTGENYVEAHHLIPIKYEDNFDVSLDVEANVVSLCPVCHKLVHHGDKARVMEIVTLLYEKRKQRLNDAGIHNVDIERILKDY